MDHETVDPDAMLTPPEGFVIIQVSVTTDGGSVIMASTFECGPFDTASFLAEQTLAMVPLTIVQPARALEMLTIQNRLF